MKKITIIILAIIITSVGIVVARISAKKEVTVEQTVTAKPTLTSGETDVTAWD